jgi:serine/threonine-protein kinase
MNITPERWQQIARVYEAAVDLDERARAPFLAEACAGDDALRREVESLLENDSAEVLVDAPVLATAAPLFDGGAELPHGSRLGPYRIDGPLDAGGMGTVFRALDTRLNRHVAIKVLPDGVGRVAQVRARFAREARAIAALTHPNICTLYDVGRQGVVDYLVMEYLEGETLAARLTHGPLPLGVALTYATEIAGALAHAHRHRIVHRDLKPANVMLTASGSKLLDFGVAKFRESARARSSSALASQGGILVAPSDFAAEHAEADAASVTRSGTILGTVRYMSPEQIEGREADTRSDLFSFGAVLYEMLTGQQAFKGHDVSTIRSAILESHLPAITSLQPQVPPAVDAIVNRCLAKDPDQRWQTANDIVHALEQASDSNSQMPGQAASPTTSHRVKWLAVVMLIAGFAGSGGWFLSHTRQLTPATPPSSSIRSIAVLPLESQSADQEYFVDGITDELIAELAKIGALDVIARTSTLHYKNTRKTIPTIARELKVDAVIEGSVVHARDQVRITAKLISGRTGDTIWTQSFERELRDVLALQRDVAQAIATNVDITLTPQAQVRLSRARPVDPELHRQILLGRHQTGKSTEESLRKAIGYFDAVISKDPDNALAHAGLAEAYIELSGYYMHPRQAMPKAKRAAETALTLDDSLADAHAALGYVHLAYDWDGPAAERELLRALELNPTLAMARLNYASYLASQGRHDDAVREIRRAVSLDPLSMRTYSFGTLFLLFTRRYDEAIELARKGLEFEPRSAFAMAFQGAGFAEQGRHDEAVAALSAAVQLDNSLTLRALQAHVLAVAGRHDEARTLVRQVEDESKSVYFCPYEIATVYVSLGDQEAATRWFRKGLDDRADCMAWLGVEPWIEPFRSDPRYVSLLKEIGLTPPPMTGR